MKRKFFLSLVFLFVCFSSVTAVVQAAKKPKNQWAKVVSDVCKANTLNCSDKIIQKKDFEQTNACVSCCAETPDINDENNCFNYCICKCSLKANPFGTNTRKFCSRKEQIPQP